MRMTGGNKRAGAALCRPTDLLQSFYVLTRQRISENSDMFRLFDLEPRLWNQLCNTSGGSSGASQPIFYKESVVSSLIPMCVERLDGNI